MNIVNSISKKVFNYVINVFTDLEGISFEGNDFKLEVDKLINRYYKEQGLIDLNKMQVTEVSIINKEIEIVFGGIDIDTEVIRKEYGVDEIPYVEAEIVFKSITVWPFCDGEGEEIWGTRAYGDFYLSNVNILNRF